MPKPSAAETAKAALRRLALSKLEPTPENYARAWAEEGGAPPAAAPAPAAPAPAASNAKAKNVHDRIAARLFEDGTQREEFSQAMQRADWEAARGHVERAAESQLALAQGFAQTIEKLARGLERGGRQWTAARKKDSLQRVLEANRSDIARLHQRLKQLVASWDGDITDDTISVDESADGQDAPSTRGVETLDSGSDSAPQPTADRGASELDVSHGDWPPVLSQYDATLHVALPVDDERALEIAGELRELQAGLLRDGATAPLRAQAEAVCERARRLLAHRHHLVDELHRLTLEMSAGLAEVAEEGSWVKGQTESLKLSLGDSPSVRSVRAASEMLAQTRARQARVRAERDSARTALKDAISQMLTELDALGDHTGRFSDNVARYVDTIAGADSLESLASVVRQMVEEGRAVHGLVSETQGRINEGRQRAAELEARVQSLESELRRLSDEVSTDVLTEVANRRGLMQAFDVETARLERQGGELAIGLLDIDNFKKLNDTLGHSVGDMALKTLAGHVQKQLRAVDIVARFGGEEFVVLLPGVPVDEAQVTLTRLQRTLSASLFMHDGREVFVTFSAGVTQFRPGEALEAALERADEALYEAKRTGKNRTCIG
ncbi:sensor domain-containing diguanylate cyclase [Scleromatobacter humisilvae]|uniref:diguanylate cyclase n=1 Tax=Scleromatobacter humisilvae TaxID=2897159 RepID=A0A9X2C140_9BURK|nr:GGDEF domain-containing protein [Scleromatobacter humisilvae]MCK9684575.1 GGDEF domain-containing protein [Scleromatobacter humisilvae]